MNLKNGQLVVSQGEVNRLFFTSDTHFGHKNIIEFCDRRNAEGNVFSCIEDHDDYLIKQWNAVVPKDGIVFHLGDFAFCGTERAKEIFDSLNGKIYLCLGNHDYKNSDKYKELGMFADIQQQYVLEYIDIARGSRSVIGSTTKKVHYRLFLNHFPFLCYTGALPINFEGTKIYQLFGHVHSSPREDLKNYDTERVKLKDISQYDVGVDNNNLRPISWKELKSKLSNKYSIR